MIKTLKGKVYVNGSRLRALRIKRGLSRQGVADKADISATLLSNIESIQKTASLSEIKEIAFAYRISVKSLFERGIISRMPFYELKEEKSPPKIKILKVDVFNYYSIKEYLQELFKRNKTKYGWSFSYDYLTQKLGYKNKSFLYKIIKGNKPASDYLINRLIYLMDMPVKEAMYLILLLHFSKVKIKEDEKKRLIKEYKRFLKRKG